MTRPYQGLSSLAPGVKMRDPGNEVDEELSQVKQSRLVWLLALPWESDTFTASVSVSVSQCRHNVHSRSSLSRSRLLTVHSSAGITFKTLKSLEMNLVSRKFPLFSNCISRSDASVASSAVGTEKRQSST